MRFATLVSASSGLLSSVTAHMLLRSPVPFARYNGNGPLQRSGTDYPCMLGAGPYTPSGRNIYAIGSTQTLKFTGSSVHGGGSCQLSVTEGSSPTSSSVFRVIHSIVGGCPSRTANENLKGDASLDTPDTYNFTVPQIPPNNYTFAWTWFNKIGAREMYMNCAPIEIVGQGGSSSVINGLPEIFKANVYNIGADTCTTDEGVDIEFPDPGISVDRPEGPFRKFAAPNGCDLSSPAPSTAVSSKPITSALTSVSTTRMSVTMARDMSSAASTGTSLLATASSASTIRSGSCSAEGDWNCIDGASFQRCASGVWSVRIFLSKGTSCVLGIANNIRIS